MPSAPRPIGYSTGAIAKGDVRRAMSILAGLGTTAIELSALRLSELEPVLAALDDLPLDGFTHVSIHAPSRFSATEERAVLDRLTKVAARGFAIVVHPDTMHDLAVYRAFGKAACIENMDGHKTMGRSLEDLARVFDRLPDARFCFDIGHAHQIDRSLGQARRMLENLGDKLVQVHVSYVDDESCHQAIPEAARIAFQEIAGAIPSGVPLILETPVQREAAGSELAVVRELFAVPS